MRESILFHALCPIDDSFSKILNHLFVVFFVVVLSIVLSLINFFFVSFFCTNFCIVFCIIFLYYFFVSFFYIIFVVSFFHFIFFIASVSLYSEVDLRRWFKYIIWFLLLLNLKLRIPTTHELNFFFSFVRLRNVKSAQTRKQASFLNLVATCALVMVSLPFYLGLFSNLN